MLVKNLDNQLLRTYRKNDGGSLLLKARELLNRFIGDISRKVVTNALKFPQSCSTKNWSAHVFI